MWERKVYSERMAREMGGNQGCMVLGKLRKGSVSKRWNDEQFCMLIADRCVR